MLFKEAVRRGKKSLHAGYTAKMTVRKTSTRYRKHQGI